MGYFKLKFLGIRGYHDTDNKHIRIGGTEISYRRWGFSLGLNTGDDEDERYVLHFQFIKPSFYITLPFKNKRALRRGEPNRYGVTWPSEHQSIYLRWGSIYKFIEMPWQPMWVRTSYLLKNGTWIHETKENRIEEKWGSKRQEWEESLWRETHPYVGRSSRIDKTWPVQATITVEEREWRWKWFMWLPWTKDVSRTISVEFSSEVGPGKGSWKGGVTGCGYEMKKGETPYECLKRMESERVFDR